MEKKMIVLLCGALAFSAAGGAVIVQNTETQTTTTSTTASSAAAPAAEGEGISILTYEASEPPMSVGEAAWALARSTAVVSMDIASDTTVSEAAFALSSMLYSCDKTEAELALKDLFYNAPSNEARVYALMGIYSFGKIADFNELLNSIDKTAEISAVVGGKPYVVSIEKFFATFKKNPSMFVPTSFPPKNLTFEAPASSVAAAPATTTTTTTTTTTYSNIAFTTWSPAIWMPDLIFWNPFYRPIVVISHGHRPPRHHIRPPAPRPIPPRPRPPHPKTPNAKPPSNPGSNPPPVKYSPARPKVGSSAKGVKNRQPSAASLTKLDLDAKVYNAPKKAQPDSASKPAPKPQTPPKSAQPNPRSDSPKTSAPRTAPQQRSSATKTSSSTSARPSNSRSFSAPKSAPARVSAPNSSAPRAQPSRRR